MALSPFNGPLVAVLGTALSASLFLASCGQPVDGKEPIPSASRGVLDLSGRDPEALYRLGGEWLFWNRELLSPEECRKRSLLGEAAFQAVPSQWVKLGPFTPQSELDTAATLALEVILPSRGGEWAIRLPNASTACALYVDGELKAEIGKVSADRSLFVPSNGITVVPFAAEGDRVSITLQIANFAAPYTGIWDSPTLGPRKAIEAKRQGDLVTAALVGGSLLFMGLYHLGLFLLRRKDPTTLVFALICLSMTVRNLIMGERILLEAFPQTWAGWQAAFTVEHLSAHLTLPLFLLFFKFLFPRYIRREAVWAAAAAGFLWALLEIFTPAMFHQRFLPWMEYLILAGALYILGALAAAAYKREDGAAIIIGGVLIMSVTVANDVLLSNGLIESFYMSTIGLFVFTFSQSFFLSARFSKLFSMVEGYSRDLENLNQSLERFIPHEVLGFLSKKSIVDVRLGDFSEEFMSVFFLDIRNFTALSEGMNPAETFRFINAFLERFGPVIREQGGFIDKYLGDGFMALFPGYPDRALDAALAMRPLLEEFNRSLGEGISPIRYGIGINSGRLMVGTIGENRRMDSTVISDTVNTASRLEQLTKTHGTDVLISDATVRALDRPDRYPLEKIGDERIKGRIGTVGVFKLANRVD